MEFISFIEICTIYIIYIKTKKKKLNILDFFSLDMKLLFIKLDKYL